MWYALQQILKRRARHGRQFKDNGDVQHGELCITTHLRKEVLGNLSGECPGLVLVGAACFPHSSKPGGCLRQHRRITARSA
jgi:hypothetical protein